MRSIAVLIMLKMESFDESRDEYCWCYEKYSCISNVEDGENSWATMFEIYAPKKFGVNMNCIMV